MRTIASVMLAALVLAGCSSGGRESTRPSTADTTVEAPRPSPSSSAMPAGGGPATPATSSGPLDAEDVPRATGLGDDWHEYADPGGAEAGFAGNGSFVRERQPGEVVQGLVPLGCPGVERVGPVPRPAHALEATYRTDAAAPAVALVLEYDDVRGAVAAVRQLERQRATCTPPEGGVAPGRTVIRIQHADDDRIWDRRRTVGEPGAAWLEVVARVDRRVGVLAMAASEQPRGGFAALDRALQGSLSHP